MARTARSMIREATVARKNGIDDMPAIADDGYKTIQVSSKRSNPLADMIDDETYALLESHGLIYEKALRDYQIRKSYREMRERMASADAIEKLREAHPYLQYDTIRKIIYAKVS